MDFFEQQKKNRRLSRWILVNFALVVVLIAVLIHLTATVFSLSPGQTVDIWSVSLHAKLIIGCIWLTIFFGGVFRWMDVRGGGARLAHRFGARLIEPGTRSDVEHQLLDVVAEMAVAANVPEPSVWIMQRETSINAFVVGNGADGRGQGDIALVLSHGALDVLDRQELQGVVGHEFGHIVHGDLPVNMRLLIVLGGLLALDEVGRTLTGRNPEEYFHPGVVVGMVLRGLGSIGVFAGKLIRAAFSRRREFLADASAVQFTRDKFGLASALDKIDELYGDAALNSPYADELAHLCFHSDHTSSWLWRAFATHPAPAARIVAIDPYFSIRKRKKREQQKNNLAENSTGGVMAAHSAGIPFVVETETISSTDLLELTVSDSMSAVALLYALFISKDAQKKKQYFSAIAFAYDKQFAERVKTIGNQLGDQLEQHCMKTIDLIVPKLCEVKSENRRLLLLNLEKLVDAEGESNLKNYATVQLLRRRLQSDFPILDKVVDEQPVVAEQRRAKPIEHMTGELALLLSLMVEASGSDPARLESDYRRVLKCYTDQYVPRRSSNDEGVVVELKQAFQKLLVQPPFQREAFVRHCAEIIHFDGLVITHERLLLDLFAASLDVPANL